ncbi:MAG: hypothetical protein AAF515_19080 [Pseudomonadota bacterium]
MIFVTMTGTNAAGDALYQVDVEGETETQHEVSLADAVYRRLCDGGVTHEWLIVSSFKFLLEREPNTSILPRFALEEIESYFPGYEVEMRRRLSER